MQGVDESPESFSSAAGENPKGKDGAMVGLYKPLMKVHRSW